MRSRGQLSLMCFSGSHAFLGCNVLPSLLSCSARHSVLEEERDTSVLSSSPTSFPFYQLYQDFSEGDSDSFFSIVDIQDVPRRRHPRVIVPPPPVTSTGESQEVCCALHFSCRACLPKCSCSFVICVDYAEDVPLVCRQVVLCPSVPFSRSQIDNFVDPESRGWAWIGLLSLALLFCFGNTLLAWKMRHLVSGVWSYVLWGILASTQYSLIKPVSSSILVRHLFTIRSFRWSPSSHPLTSISVLPGYAFISHIRMPILPTLAVE